jgi:hypothetical protein
LITSWYFRGLDRLLYRGDFDMFVSFRRTATVSIAALALSTLALTAPASAAGSTWHGGHAGWHGGGGGWRGGGNWGGAGVGLAVGALAGAALAAPYYYGGDPGYCDPYYGCNNGYGPAYGYGPVYGYAPSYGYAPNYGYIPGGNSGGANFPQ